MKIDMKLQYHSLAPVYDKLLGEEIDYALWADRIEAVFDQYLPKRPELVLDLACGTGNMTFELAKKGYDMIGVDLSQEMLSSALQRGYETCTKNSILFLNQDMKGFELYGTVGAVVCCLDSINYLTGKDDLEKCFSCVHNYLDPDGIFIFDVNTPYKFENVYGDNSYILEDEGIYCGWQNSYNRKTGICDFDLTIFEKNADGTYRRSDENQREKQYSLKKLKDTLQKCGFEFLSIHDGFLEKEIFPESERWTITARALKANA